VIRVLVVEAYAPFREMLRAFLRACPREFELVGETSSSAEAFNLTGRLQPDVLLLDLDDLTGESHQVIGWLRQDEPGIGLVTCAAPGEAADWAAREAGPQCHLSKPFDLAQLKQALKQAAWANRRCRGGVGSPAAAR